jgi:flagellar hook assembly protein FlgD
MRNVKVIALVVLLSISIGFICATVNNLVSNVNIEPNPMDKTANISLSMTKNAAVRVNVETLDGEVVKTIYNGNMNIGNYEFNWNRIDNDGVMVPSGSYYLVIEFDSRYTSIKKTLILK